jgi:hypothetical protein
MIKTFYVETNRALVVNWDYIKLYKREMQLEIMDVVNANAW